MKLERHIFLAIEDFYSNRLDSALMHACFSIDATAKKLFKTRGRSGYKNLLRKYYWIISPMLGAGIDIENTKFKNLEIFDENKKPIHSPDLADIIYHIFRCPNAHGEEIPKNYTLTPSFDGYAYWKQGKDSFSIPDRIIWSILAVSVFCKINKDIKTDTDHFLTWGSESLGLGIKKFLISENWGREDLFFEFISKYEFPKVTILGLDNLVHPPKSDL